MGPTEAGPTVSVGVYIAECQRVLEGYKPKGISYEVSRRAARRIRTSKLFEAS